MKFRLLEEGKGNRGNLEGVKVTYKINIYRLKVTLVTLVTSIFLLTREEIKNTYILYLSFQKLPKVCKYEVTEVTEVTRPLMIALFRLPLSKVEVTWRHLRGNLRAAFPARRNFS
jgi:hypothetical protein